MNVYFLVEGKRTEPLVYESWLKHKCPHLHRIQYPGDLTQDTYYLVSGEGYPKALTRIEASVLDVNKYGYDYLVICLDTDTSQVKDRIRAIESRLKGVPPLHSQCHLHLIIQEKCIESWFLGNRSIVPDCTADTELQRYLELYDIRLHNPEKLGNLCGRGSLGSFHVDYLRRCLKAQNAKYSKCDPGPVLEWDYLAALEARVQDSPEHLIGFQRFLDLMQKLQ